MTTLYPYSEDSHLPAHNFFIYMEKLIGQRIYPFSSARAGLVFGLRALGLCRQDEILVPAYLSHCVLSAISRVAFPTLTQSRRTKAVLVWDQFGFPQDQHILLAEAKKNDWVIVNDRAHSFYQASLSQDAIFGVFSIAKFFPCIMGGAFTTQNSVIQNCLDRKYASLAKEHADRAKQARSVLVTSHHKGISGDTAFDVEGVFGYLPEIVAFPEDALRQLPRDMDEIHADRTRRESFWTYLSEAFPERVPAADDTLAPFAIPLSGERNDLERASMKLAEVCEVEAPVLNFDFALNMFSPNYQPALVIGCHSGWSPALVERVVACLKDIL